MVDRKAIVSLDLSMVLACEYELSQNQFDCAGESFRGR